MPFKVSSGGNQDKMALSTDQDLFKMMKESENDPSAARTAWAQFYKRYSSYLWNCCLRICKTVTEGDVLAKDIFQSTMQKIFAQAKTYKSEKGKSTKSWISRIAYNEFIDHYNRYNQRFVFYDDPPNVEDEQPSDKDEAMLSDTLLSIKLDQLKLLLSKLSAKEFKILMTCMNYYQIDNPNAHLPDSEMERLCVEFNIQSDAVRQIKRRALLKLQKLTKELQLNNTPLI